MSILRHDRHKSALQLLRSLTERNNGGRWETITVDFDNKPIKSSTSATLIHTPLTATHMPLQHVHMYSCC
jgi:hypothetical protein